MTRISDDEEYQAAVTKVRDGVQELIDEFMQKTTDTVNGGMCVDDSWTLLIGQQEFDSEMKPDNGFFTFLSKKGTPFWKVNGLCQTYIQGPGKS